MAEAGTAAGAKVALVTGASSGIGRALALELARRGYHVGLVARRQAELESLAKEVEALGREACIATADVADRLATESACAAIEKRFSRIDLLIANAGVGQRRASKEQVFDVDAAIDVHRINLFGVIHAVGAVLPGMLARKSGHICAVSSLSAYLPIPRTGGYASSKAAVNLWLEGLRIDLRGRGVLTTVVNPGFVDTPLTAKNKGRMPFLQTPERAARIICDGLARGKRTIEFPLPLVWIVKWARMLPSWLLERLMQGRGF